MDGNGSDKDNGSRNTVVGTVFGDGFKSNRMNALSCCFVIECHIALYKDGTDQDHKDQPGERDFLRVNHLCNRITGKLERHDNHHARNDEA